MDTTGLTLLIHCQIRAMSSLVAGCMSGWLYFLAHDMQEWFVKAGLPIEAARLLVLGNFNDCVASALRQSQRAIATPGIHRSRAEAAAREVCQRSLKRCL